jgi:two-component sensor histidine kinase
MVSYLADSFNTGQRIRFALDIAPIEMDVGQAVPLGLILNEAITNSIKYAFPDDRSGVISVLLSKTAPEHYLLGISDNGVGMHAGVRKTGSLGMSLMQGLSEDINGDFSIENHNGTSIRISFAADVAVKAAGRLSRSFANA